VVVGGSVVVGAAVVVAAALVAGAVVAELVAVVAVVAVTLVLLSFLPAPAIPAMTSTPTTAIATHAGMPNFFRFHHFWAAGVAAGVAGGGRVGGPKGLSVMAETYTYRRWSLTISDYSEARDVVSRTIAHPCGSMPTPQLPGVRPE
jgi:hypothetical protein